MLGYLQTALSNIYTKNPDILVESLNTNRSMGNRLAFGFQPLKNDD